MTRGRRGQDDRQPQPWRACLRDCARSRQGGRDPAHECIQRAACGPSRTPARRSGCAGETGDGQYVARATIAQVRDRCRPRVAGRGEPGNQQHRSSRAVDLHANERVSSAVATTSVAAAEARVMSVERRERAMRTPPVGEHDGLPGARGCFRDERLYRARLADRPARRVKKREGV